MASRWRSPPERSRPRSPMPASKPSGLRVDEFERLGALGGVAHFGDGGVGLADAQILRDRAVEQQRLLKHHADIAAQPGGA